MRFLLVGGAAHAKWADWPDFWPFVAMGDRYTAGTVGIGSQRIVDVAVAEYDVGWINPLIDAQVESYPMRFREAFEDARATVTEVVEASPAPVSEWMRRFRVRSIARDGD